MDAARDEIVARALGAAGGQDRGLEFGEALLDHPPADRGDDRRAQHDVGVDLLAAKVEVAVAEADFLGIILLAGDRHRKLGGARLDRDRADDHLDVAGRELGVHRTALAVDDFAVDRHHQLDTQRIEQLQRIRPGAGDQLGQAVMIAQIDEQHPAMVALAVDPARQLDGRSDVARTERGAMVGTVGVHGGISMLVMPAKGWHPHRCRVDPSLRRGDCVGTKARASLSRTLLSTRGEAAIGPRHL